MIVHTVCFELDYIICGYIECYIGILELGLRRLKEFMRENHCAGFVYVKKFVQWAEGIHLGDGIIISEGAL